MLFNEPKLLKSTFSLVQWHCARRFSALQRAEIAEIARGSALRLASTCFSALQRAEIAEMARASQHFCCDADVSVLFNEPKLLKFDVDFATQRRALRFSALQRAEIAEICRDAHHPDPTTKVSVLFNEPKLLKSSGLNETVYVVRSRFSALQRAEIAEIPMDASSEVERVCFSALQRAEIAEMRRTPCWRGATRAFQCSSTSRNC